jgi:acyl-CoA dehydrogenase
VSKTSEVIALLVESVETLLTRHCPPTLVSDAEGPGWSAELWNRLELAELTRVGIAEAYGGGGGGIEEASALVLEAARFAAPVPLAETCLLGGWLLAESGLEVPPGPISAGVLVDGSALVPYGRCASAIVLLKSGGELLLIRNGEYEIEIGANIAGEARDIIFPKAGAGIIRATPVAIAQFRLRAALARAVQIAGALEAVVDMTLSYAAMREQFGSPLYRFQAVQELMVTVTEESIAASAAVRAAVRQPSVYRIAVAKARTSEAAGAVAQKAHQVHGAIGFTREHSLQQYTRRLWSWRDEYGSESEWSLRVGDIVFQAGPTRLWSLVTAEGAID